MSERMTISFVVDPDWEPGVRVQLEVGGVVQPDRVLPLSGRERQVLGFLELGAFMLGHSAAVTLGEGRLGDGTLGIGARQIDHTTLNRFDAGDYAVRLRTFDRLGNAGAWSEPVTIEHRPAPTPPRRVRVNAAGDALTWLWP